MSVTPADIKLEYPEFSGIDDAVITLIISTYQKQILFERWGEMVDEGIKTRVAHELAVKYAHQLQLGAAVKALQVQKPFAFAAKGEEYFQLSPYGQKYQQLLQELPSVGMTVI